MPTSRRPTGSTPLSTQHSYTMLRQHGHSTTRPLRKPGEETNQTSQGYVSSGARPSYMSLTSSVINSLPNQSSALTLASHHNNKPINLSIAPPIDSSHHRTLYSMKGGQ